MGNGMESRKQRRGEKSMVEEEGVSKEKIGDRDLAQPPTEITVHSSSTYRRSAI